jgi:PAS domain S-box-containing protein
MGTVVSHSPAILAPDLHSIHLLISSVLDYAIFLVDTTGHVASWNTGAARFYGYDADEIAGQQLSRLYPVEAVRRDWPQHMLSVAKVQGRFEDDGWQIRKDGSSFWGGTVITALRESDGQLRSFLNVTRDLTETRRQVEALRQSEERLRLLVEGASDYAVLTLDPDGNVTSWNSSARQLKGYESGEVIGEHISRFYPAEAVKHGLPHKELAVARERGRSESEGWRVRKDGSLVWLKSVTTPLRDSDGKLRGFVRVTHDLTEKRRQEVALRESEQQFRSLVDGATDYAIYTLDPEGNIRSWNAGARLLIGYEAGEVVGTHISRYYPPEDTEQAQHELALAASRGRSVYEGWRVRKDGSRVWVHSVTTALRDPAGQLTGFARVTRDRTESRRQEEALRESEERFRSLIEGVRDYAICTLDPDGYVTSWNPGARLIGGWEPDEVIGRHFSSFYAPEDIERGWPQHSLVVASAQGRFEDEGWRARKDGFFWANVVTSVIRRPTGSIIGYSIILRDLSERHRREESLTEAQERLRQRAGALEESVEQMRKFVAEVTHELRGPLAPIRNAASVMAAQALTPAVEQLRQTIDRQSGILSGIVDDLSDINRVEQGSFSIESQPLQLNDVLSGAVEACRPLIEAHGQSLQADWPAEPIWLLGDTTKLTQVFINLLTNASKYSADGEQIGLSVEAAGTKVTVRVTDTGSGIPPESLESIFSPFTRVGSPESQTTDGLGLGLSIARRIVELHHGTVKARSEGVGRGSEFVVTLPLTSETLRSEILGSGPGSARAARILWVGENPKVATSLVGLLEAMGHEAQTAQDAVTALSTAHNFQPEIVLVDIDAEGINGYELAGRLLEQQRDAQPMLVALTDWAQESGRQRAQAAGFRRYLLKPVTREAVEGMLAALSPGEDRGPPSASQTARQ